MISLKDTKKGGKTGKSKDKKEEASEPKEEFTSDKEKIEHEFKQIINDPCKMLYVKPIGKLSKSIFCESSLHKKF